MAHPTELVDAERFWRVVNRRGVEECWPWLGRLDRYGYGEYVRKVGGRNLYWRAHRVAFELTRGRIPDGLVLDHLCRVRACVNPNHLEPVTSAENTRRSDLVGRALGAKGASRRTLNADGQPVCRNGHVVSGETAIPRVDRRRPGRVYLMCRVCAIDRKRRWRR